MRLLHGALLASVVLSPLALLADDRRPPTNKDEFLAIVNGQDSHLRALAVARLDPDRKEDYDLLRMVLERGDWHLRAAASDTLARMKNTILLKDMASRVLEKSERRPLVREGMVAALAKRNDKTVVPDLCKALADHDWHVRRQVAYALRDTTDKSAVDALIARWKDEKNPLVANYIRRTLEDVTHAYNGPTAGPWASFWSRSREKIELSPALDEESARVAAEAAKKAEEDGKKLLELTTTSRDVELVHDDIGVGVPVLVLPEYGYSKELMIPFFIEIEKVARVQYVELPKITDFKNLPSSGDLPYYPVDKLVDAFEEVRKAAKVEKIAILASGINSWVAMRYATRYPKHVVGLIFISPQSSTEKRKEATDRILRKARVDGDTELLHYGLTRHYDAQRRMDEHEMLHADQRLPIPDGEPEALDRKEFSIRFAEQQESILEELYPVHARPLGDCLVPEFKVFSEQAVDVPVLVCSGTHSIIASEGDCQGVADHYKGMMVSFDHSGDFPFIEEPEKFSTAVTQFLLRYIGKPPKKK